MPVKQNSRQAFRSISLWLPVLACLSIIFCASSIPGARLPRLLPLQDTAFHFFIYLCLGFFLVRALRRARPDIAPAKIVLFVVAFGIIYGIIDELHQAFVPLRHVSGLDLFIDSLGSAIGSLIYR